MFTYSPAFMFCLVPFLIALPFDRYSVSELISHLNAPTVGFPEIEDQTSTLGDGVALKSQC